MISIDSFRHFIAVVENGGVNRAAHKAAISPSSLSRSIRMIEDQVGKRIFDRVGRKVVLNVAGQALFEKAKALVRDFDLVASAASGGGIAGHYQVGASHFLCAHFAPARLAGLLAAHPLASFSLLSLDTHAVVKRLSEGSLDVGFGFSPRDAANLSRRTLSTGTMNLCAGRRSKLARLPFSRLVKALNEVPALMHRPTDSTDRCDNHPMFKKHGIRPRIRLYWDSDEAAVQLLKAGDCWTLLPEIVIRSDPGIVRLSHPADWSAPYEICLLRNQNRTSEELESAFLSERGPTHRGGRKLA